MNPFTLFFGRLVELLGAEKAAELVREFSGQNIQLPASSLYQIPNSKPKRQRVLYNQADVDELLAEQLNSVAAQLTSAALVLEGTRTNGKPTISGAAHIPKGFDRRQLLRHQEMLAAWNGNNSTELARHYGISLRAFERAIYRAAKGKEPSYEC